MGTGERIETRHAWLASLAVASPAIGSLGLASVPDGKLDADGYNFANSPEHNLLIARAVKNCVQNLCAPSGYMVDLMKNLLRNNTYGAFSEIAAYDFLIRSNINISGQISVSSDRVLGKNKTILDGFITHCGIYFDVKAFGFHGYLARRLKLKLEKLLPGKVVFIEESWDLSVGSFRRLIRNASQIAEALRNQGTIWCGRLRIRVEKPRPVHVSGITLDPFLLAEENSEYAFRSAHQFPRDAPFLIFYTLHPWFNQGTMQHDFAGVDSTFSRAFARRTFMQFKSDIRKLDVVCPKAAPGITFAEASKLLSGIIFLNVWPSEFYTPGTSESKRVPSWIYLNPRAVHPVSRGTARLFAQIDPHIQIDDFIHDHY